MATLKLYYATNRNHIGRRWSPASYGTRFSAHGMENLRFGVVSVEAEEAQISKFVSMGVGSCGAGDGEKLAVYLSGCARSAKIEAYRESTLKNLAHSSLKKSKLGSRAMFTEVQTDMESASDVLIYIHGFNVSWYDAVGSALSLQTMLQSKGEQNKKVAIILFSWPSDGLALPWVSYRSDRSEARGSGAAFGRALLKARDFLADLRDRAKGGGKKLCQQDIHLLCHSMGNYLLQETLARMVDFTPSRALPRIFEHVFLCAPDIDDKALEPGQPLEKIDQFARNITIYHNREDAAMVISDYTKGHPERLGGTGAAHPGLLHNKVFQVDCSAVVHGYVEHDYYLTGKVVADIRSSIDGWDQTDKRRNRNRKGLQINVWAMK